MLKYRILEVTHAKWLCQMPLHASFFASVYIILIGVGSQSNDGEFIRVISQIADASCGLQAPDTRHS